MLQSQMIQPILLTAYHGRQRPNRMHLTAIYPPAQIQLLRFFKSGKLRPLALGMAPDRSPDSLGERMGLSARPNAKLCLLIVITWAVVAVDVDG